VQDSDVSDSGEEKDCFSIEAQEPQRKESLNDVHDYEELDDEDIAMILNS